MGNRPPGDSGAPDDLLQRLTEGLRRAAEGIGRQLGESFPVLTESNGAAKRVVRDVPNVSFADVGGCEEAKRELESICAALKTPDLYKRWGTRPPRGVLLYGAPGTGKTLLARCVAGQADAEFIHIRAVDVASMWYGQAEKQMQSAFDEARRRAPCVLFLDEVDALTPPREMAHEATGRVIATLLENLDGLLPLEGVAVLAATNRLDAVDPAFTRPGRLDRLVHVPLPGAEARRQILAVHRGRAEKLAGRELFALSDYRRFIRGSDGMSGADIEELVRRVLENRVRAGAVEGLISEGELLATMSQFEWGRAGRARRRRRWWEW
jgi:transitional endoplasmic reticulum ATPase